MKTPVMYKGIIEKYRDFLPVSASTPIVSLNEGNTPLVQLHNIPKSFPVEITVYVKYEGLNPTSSFKDRGMTMAVSKALEEGSRAIICASTGNTSAAAAAYAARAGIKAFVLIPEGKIALGKLAQTIIYGAHVIQIQGNFDQSMQIVKDLENSAPVTIVNSINPYRLQGQKTAAFEIVEQLGQAPDFHCLPVGNAGNISAYWMGYTEFQSKGLTQRRPKMLGYQASGAAPFIHGKVILNPETVATAIRIGNPQSWDLAKKAQSESQGWFSALDDADILKAQQLLASREGIFCEPASAASIAGLLRDVHDGKIPAGSTVVCTLTGHGLKDPDIAIQQSQQQLISIKANADVVKQMILEKM